MAGGSPPHRFTASNFQRSAREAGRPASHGARGASRFRDVGLKRNHQVSAALSRKDSESINVSVFIALLWVDTRF